MPRVVNCQTTDHKCGVMVAHSYGRQWCGEQITTPSTDHKPIWLNIQVAGPLTTLHGQAKTHGTDGDSPIQQQHVDIHPDTKNQSTCLEPVPHQVYGVMHVGPFIISVMGSRGHALTNHKTTTVMLMLTWVVGWAKFHG